MKKLNSFLGFGLVTFILVAGTGIVYADAAYLHPYHDTGWGTFGLWHLDSVSTDPNFSWIKYTADDDANDPQRNHDMKLSGSAKPAIAASFSPEFGNCMYFDGTCHLQTNTEDRDSLGIDGTNFKAEAWFKLADPTRYEMDFEYDMVAQYDRWWIGVVDSSWAGNWLVVFNTQGTDGKYHTVTATFDANSWHHVAGSFNIDNDGNAVQQLYLDGTLVSTLKFGAPDSSVLKQPGRRVAIGYTLKGSSPYNKFYGWIDEVRISQAVPTPVPCGFWGYLNGDLNADCHVNTADLKQMADSWLGAGIEDMEYATQTAAELTWWSDPLVGQAQPLTLNTEKNHTPGGSKSLKCNSPYQSSIHVFNEIITKGAIELWFYDSYNPLVTGAVVSMDIRRTLKNEDSYFSIGVNSQIEPEDNYFIYASDVGWMNPILGPSRTEGWHKVRMTFGDKDPVTGVGPGGSLYLDDMHIADNNDMRLGINTIRLGNSWYYGTGPFYFDDVRYIGDQNVYIGPADINVDAKVNFVDFALMARYWMECTDPLDPTCIDAR